jgi:hypothetical protein
MAANRNAISIISQLDPAFSKKWVVASGGVGTIAAGSPAKTADAAAASPYLGTVVPMVDGDGTTSQRFCGVAKTDSTDTASADGVVQLWLPLPGMLYRAKVKTSTGADTQAEVDALSGKRVVFDLTTSVWTVDAAAADAVVNNVVIVGGDFRTQTVDFVYSTKGTVLDFCISA